MKPAALSILLMLFAQTALAETKIFVMPDGSKMTVEIPKGMTYTQEEAVKAWESANKMERERRMAEESKRLRSSSYGDSIAALERQVRQSSPLEQRTIPHPTNNDDRRVRELEDEVDRLRSDEVVLRSHMRR